MKIYLAYKNGILRKYELSEAKQTDPACFSKQRELKIENGINSFQLINSKLWVGSEGGLFILDEDLDLLKTNADIKHITAISAVDDIYIVAERLLIKFFDKNLTKLNEYTIDKPGWLVMYPSFKGIDDIIIFNNYVYLLDDVCRPLFTYRFELPKNFKEAIHSEGFLHLYYFTGTNTSLPFQILIPDKNYWCVLSRRGTMGGESEDMLLFDMYETDEIKQRDEEEEFIYKDISKIKFYKEFNFYRDIWISELYGNRMIDIIRIAPNYCIALDVAYHVALYELQVDCEGVKFKYLHLLNRNLEVKQTRFNRRYSGKIYHKGKFLYGWYQFFKMLKFFIFNIETSKLELNAEFEGMDDFDKLTNIEVCLV